MSVFKYFIFLFLFSASKCVSVVNTKGENINICWSPDGNTIAVGNKVSLSKLTCRAPISAWTFSEFFREGKKYILPKVLTKATNLNQI